MMDGELMPFADAKLHPLSLAVTYATTVFEGIRAYHMPKQGKFALFRLDEHMKRLQVGMKVLRLEADFGHIYVDFPQGRQRVSVLLLTWSHSGFRFAVALPSEQTEAILAGMP